MTKASRRERKEKKKGKGKRVVAACCPGTDCDSMWNTALLV